MELRIGIETILGAKAADYSGSLGHGITGFNDGPVAWSLGHGITHWY
ncbi:hypothetical protein Q4574_15950 [Aliiglaciecola sp. 3_MG-2023]|nr:hypothetical protein [Aliiglaciecola sp. 3_MG-2023]MDO6694791.1 hypothetical protein [Aliiglaciecola sp. 3_MG-2023]